MQARSAPASDAAARWRAHAGLPGFGKDGSNAVLDLLAESLQVLGPGSRPPTTAPGIARRRRGLPRSPAGCRRASSLAVKKPPRHRPVDGQVCWPLSPSPPAPNPSGRADPAGGNSGIWCRAQPSMICARSTACGRRGVQRRRSKRAGGKRRGEGADLGKTMMSASTTSIVDQKDHHVLKVSTRRCPRWRRDHQDSP